MQVALRTDSQTEVRSAGLENLAACLRCETDNIDDWQGVLREANYHLVAPALFMVLSSSKKAVHIPDDVIAYLHMLYDLNIARNSRLRAQAIEAIRALNKVGIEPTLLKGGAILLTCPESRLSTRMISDLDLMIDPEKLPRAVEALAAERYQVVAGRGEHAFASLFRSEDVGTIDLHHRPPGPERFYKNFSPALAELIQVGGSRAYIPAAIDQFVYLVVHDMIHDRRLWLGSVDVRHLLDLKDLAEAGKVDWKALRAKFRFGETSTLNLTLALEVTLINLCRLLHVDVPLGEEGSMLSRLFYNRQIFLDRNQWSKSMDLVYPAFRVCRKIRSIMGFGS